MINVFYQHQNSEQAKAMSAYMKNQFPFLGIPRPARNELQKEFMKTVKKEKQIAWDFIYKCWDQPEREFQYLAMDTLQAQHKYLNDNDMENLERLITQKSWWDTVDFLAGSMVGVICLKHPELRDSHILKWSVSENLWLRRTSLLFQLKYKEKTDPELLSHIIHKNNGSKEFFINKAIGWVLREYSKTNPVWVRGFVENHSLSPLSIREASKYLNV